MTDALKELAQREAYAYRFEDRRYDVGDKQGFFKGNCWVCFETWGFRGEFMDYLMKVVKSEKENIGFDEIIAANKCLSKRELVQST